MGVFCSEYICMIIDAQYCISFCMIMMKMVGCVCVAGACVKVIQLLQHFEQLSSVCAQAVTAWSSEYGVKAIVGEIMR